MTINHIIQATEHDLERPWELPGHRVHRTVSGFKDPKALPLAGWHLVLHTWK